DETTTATTTTEETTTQQETTTIESTTQVETTRPGETGADREKVTPPTTTKPGEVGADKDVIKKSGEVASDVAKTGDNSNVFLYVGILVAAVIILGVVFVVNRKKSDKGDE
ncbi:MAG: LPXTG cell wall anchor domain-containing protein, partial [Eubacteriales bacterium]|nr:LPXTG cell wall anchor domain-containing protein [Eubacteriales bacterium]